MFKTEAIILFIEVIRDNNIRIILLTKEFGKVSCWYKKKQFLYDIGDIVFVILERNNSINLIKHIESKNSPREEHWTYAKISIFLENLSMMYELLPEESPYETVFQDYRWLLIHMQSAKTLHEHHYLLFQFRFLRTLWYIGKEDLQNTPILRYIFENILKTPLNQLLRSKELNWEDAKTIEMKNKEIFYRSTI